MYCIRSRTWTWERSQLSYYIYNLSQKYKRT